jgi:hypothetical protein
VGWWGVHDKVDLVTGQDKYMTTDDDSETLLDDLGQYDIISLYVSWAAFSLSFIRAAYSQATGSWGAKISRVSNCLVIKRLNAALVLELERLNASQMTQETKS